MQNFDEDFDTQLLAGSFYRFGLEDTELFRRRDKGKGVERTDEEVALDLFTEDAVQTLGSFRDHALALKLQNMRDSDVDDMLADFERNLSLKSSPSKEISKNSERVKVKCIACMEDIEGKEIRLACGHHYDIDCLIDLFKISIADTLTFPPRCCEKNVPLDQAREYLDSDSIKRFEEISIELSTPLRLYCSNKECSHFLGPRGETASNVNCPKCQVITCALCCEPEHDKTVPCKDDAAAEVVLGMGKQKGWQRCLDCRQLVELDFGCYHMTCQCKAEFCYLCAARWKTCSCQLWDEERLLRQD